MTAYGTGCVTAYGTACGTAHGTASLTAYGTESASFSQSLSYHTALRKGFCLILTVFVSEMPRFTQTVLLSS